jgi:predicted DNA-binding transcriptional regulator YafY
MGDNLSLERCYWFDNQVRTKRFPNANTLAEQFEISSKTAQRSIDFMRDRIGAPLEYDPGHKGYRYSDDSFSLLAFHVSQEEMVSILLAGNLLSNSAGGRLASRQAIVSLSVQQVATRSVTIRCSVCPMK